MPQRAISATLLVLCLFLAPALCLAAEPATKRAKKAVTEDRGLAVAEKNRATGKRIALVIGNGSYRHTDSMPKLANPPNDAEDMATALRRFGFEVIAKKNLTKEEMDEAITDFGRKIADSDAALFYYAGHGLQVKGQNYMVPVDANIDSEAKVPYRAVNVNQILEEMDSSKSRVNIVMLDACRNNPISGKFRSGSSRGLAPPSTMPKGTVVVYATDPGNVAADGSGRNGLFTAGLLTAFKGSDLTLAGVLTRASEEVERNSNQQQTPYINGPATVQKRFAFNMTSPSSMTDLQPSDYRPQSAVSISTQKSKPKQLEGLAPDRRLLKLAVTAPYSLDETSTPELAKMVSDVIVFDMNMSGVVTVESLNQAISPANVDLTSWQNSGFDLLTVIGYSLTDGKLTIEFCLFDVINRKLITAKRYLGNAKDSRHLSHSFANELLRVLSGEPGVFTTRIAYVSTQTRNKEIYIMDWDGYNPLPLTKNGSQNMNPDFSPDGREIVFTSDKRGYPELYRRSISNTAEEKISESKGLNITGSWSPDGSKIAVALNKDDGSEIYIIDKFGNFQARLTQYPALELFPAWSPDGKQIAFASNRTGKSQLFVMNSDGSNVRPLIKSDSDDTNPRWSPKGDKIVYSRKANDSFNIFSISPDGTAETQLTNFGSNENPSWSADGRLICFTKRGGEDGVYVMRSDGTGQIKISQSKGTFFQPIWSVH